MSVTSDLLRSLLKNAVICLRISFRQPRTWKQLDLTSPPSMRGVELVIRARGFRASVRPGPVPTRRVRGEPSVAWPMLWLAPVMMAICFDIRTFLDSIAVSAEQEVADGGRDLRSMGLQREVAGVEEAHDRVGDVALEGLGAGRQEERIVLSPHRQEAAACGSGNRSGRLGRAQRCSCSRRTGRVALHRRRAGTDRSCPANIRPERPSSRRERRACTARSVVSGFRKARRASRLAGEASCQ